MRQRPERMRLHKSRLEEPRYEHTLTAYQQQAKRPFVLVLVDVDAEGFLVSLFNHFSGFSPDFS